MDEQVASTPKVRTPRLRRAPFPFALLVWDDAFASSGDVTVDEISHRAVRFYTAGWVLRDDPIGVSIAAEWAVDQGTWRGVTFVPRGMVIELRRM